MRNFYKKNLGHGSRNSEAKKPRKSRVFFGTELGIFYLLHFLQFFAYNIQLKYIFASIIFIKTLENSSIFLGYVGQLKSPNSEKFPEFVHFFGTKDRKFQFPGTRNGTPHNPTLPTIARRLKVSSDFILTVNGKYVFATQSVKLNAITPFAPSVIFLTLWTA